MNTDIISDGESDDFTDEEEEQQSVATPIVTRTTSTCDNELYNSTKPESNASNSQWYIDIPKNDYSESLTSQSLYGNISK
jgi:hypothetical protein